ncbi:serine kinase [Thermus phage phiYS40]|uniref:serine kinase n=1 Tax=Thermus phage phiYS40 TaxID=407392 RepID=UPI0000E689B1|nr:serine kinase [Thermus phage phiYS40]ABJ91453.1 serine kinase [Thermus phage phiYS40]BAK53577.1 serine kinase [Thermus phage phiYS40]
MKLNRFFKGKTAESRKLSFKEFLEEKFVRNPAKYSRSAHKYLFDAITYFGFDEERKIPKIFADELFGVDDKIREFMTILEAGANGHDVRRRIILFVGPVGTAKSTFVSIIKKALERYSKTEEGEIYAIEFCPIHEDPLNLIPEDTRDDFYKEFGVKIDQELCPVCRHKLKELKYEDVSTVPVVRFTFSEAERRGIATFVPADWTSQDVSVLVGSENFRAVQELGDPSHPLGWNFNGSLFVANRGIHEFIELHKAKPDLLFPLITVAQERKVKVDRFGLIDVDEVLIAHTNYAEYNKFVNKKENEALKDRTREINWIYNLRWDDEEKIYKKMLGETTYHLAPWTLKFISGIAIMSRLSPDRDKKYDLLTSLKLYNGDYGAMYSEYHVDEMKHPDDGKFGISPRVAVDALSFASVGNTCVTPIRAYEKLEEIIKSGNVDIPHKEFLALKDMILTEYNKFIKDAVFRAFIGSSFATEAQKYVDRYIENAQAFINGEKIKDPFTGNYVEPDEKFLRSIEELVGISKEAAKDFRMKILVKATNLLRMGKKITYDIHPLLKEAIENKIFGDRATFIRGSITSVVKTEEQEKHIQEAVEELKKVGFCEVCAREAISYVAYLLDVAR